MLVAVGSNSRSNSTIIITAHDDAELRRRCESAGTAAYLLKPLHDTPFFAAIAKVIGGAGA